MSSWIERMPIKGKCIVRFLCDDEGASPAKAFLEAEDRSDVTKIGATVQSLAERCFYANDQRFKPIEGHDDLFEIKNHQLRVFCCRRGDNWLLLTAVRKKRNKHRPADIERAEGFRDAYAPKKTTAKKRKRRK